MAENMADLTDTIKYCGDSMSYLLANPHNSSYGIKDSRALTYLALRSSGPLWNNGQQVSPAHTVDCHCLFLTPADSSCL